MNAIQELMTSWLSPAALFFLVNLMIGAISILMAQNKHDHSNIQNRPDEPGRAEGGPQVVRGPSFFERVRSFNLSKNRPDEPGQAERGPELLRAPSFFERVASLNLRKNRPAEPSEPAISRQHGGGDISEQEEIAGADGGGGVTVNKVMKKSASERLAAKVEEEAGVESRRPETSRERAKAGEEAVDARADDFINRFRQQLKMQRLDSILRYKEMLNRGASL